MHETPRAPRTPNTARSPFVLALAFATVLAACGSTKVTDSWSSRGAQRTKIDRIVTLYLGQDRDITAQRVAEDRMAREIRKATGVVAVPGYRVVSDDDRSDRDALQRRLESRGFDGALVMRVVDVDERTIIMPGHASGYPYGTFYGYWGYAYPMYDRGYVTTETIVRMETTLHAFPSNRLLYAARSRTIDPDSIDELVDDISEEVGEDLADRRILR